MRSGRTYLPNYIDRISKERLREILAKVNKSRIIDLNTLFANMIINPKLDRILRELGAPTKYVVRL